MSHVTYEWSISSPAKLLRRVNFATDMNETCIADICLCAASVAATMRSPQMINVQSSDENSSLFAEEPYKNASFFSNCPWYFGGSDVQSSDDQVSFAKTNGKKIRSSINELQSLKNLLIVVSLQQTPRKSKWLSLFCQRALCKIRLLFI